ncbi:MAG: DUF433 domain-containing protein [Candidatus Hydrogenedentes bacterium]|nr:DUF433 domain-containing protein [Candidatus Hydrogenedentota bacterium]
MKPVMEHGIYTVAEASRLTQLHPSRIRAWLKSRRVLSPHYVGKDSSIALDFYDLIDVRIVGLFREKRVKLSAIRRAYEQLAQDLGTDHPFCHSDLATNGQQVFLITADRIGEKSISDAISKQHYFADLIPLLEPIRYDEHTHLASRWEIRKGIVIDPMLSFGRPVVDKTSVPANILARTYWANGQDVKLTADLYNLTPKDVRNAVEFEEQFGLTRLAA